MGEQIDDHDEIVRVLGLSMQGDAERLREAFHDDARMYGNVARKSDTTCRLGSSLTSR